MLSKIKKYKIKFQKKNKMKKAKIFKKSKTFREKEEEEASYGPRQL
jgi:hypothetical protein